VTSNNLKTFLRSLARGMNAATLDERSDRELIAWLIREPSPEVFEAIVGRHGAMVYRVCRRVLPQEQDAEDAFQATFLLLAQNLASIRKHSSLASFLHGVAHRVSLKAKARTAARRRHEHEFMVSRTSSPEDLTWRELRTALDAELARLPDKWRLPLILCYLEGRTQDEAAGQLGWSKNTLRRRLNEARTALARKLRLSGAWPAALSAVLLADGLSSTAPSRGLVNATVEAAASTAASQTVAGVVVSARVLYLMEGVRTTMFLSRTRIVMALMVVVGMLVAGAGAVAYAARIGPAEDAGEVALPREEPRGSGEKEKTPDERKVKGANPEAVVIEDVVTVRYRGNMHTLTGKHAQAVRNAGLLLIGSTCLERDISKDGEAALRYATIRKRSYVQITLARQRSVSKAGNNKTPVAVKSLLIPFSPDLDPEVIYVLPGKPFRAFAEMSLDGFETIRSALIEAGIYPPEDAPVKDKKPGKQSLGPAVRDSKSATPTLSAQYAPELKEGKPFSALLAPGGFMPKTSEAEESIGRAEKLETEQDTKSLFTLSNLLYQRGDYRGVFRYLREPLDRLKKSPKLKGNAEVTRARYQFAESCRQIAAQEHQSFNEGQYLSAETQAHHKKEHRRWLMQAAEEFASLDAFLDTPAGMKHLTKEQRTQIPFLTARCWFKLEEYDKALAIYERLIKRYPERQEALEALGGAVQCDAAKGQMQEVKKRLGQIRKLLPKLPEKVGKPWEAWLDRVMRESGITQ
jgi:RNA polymerase sigma factor (sigma-70 family)